MDISLDVWAYYVYIDGVQYIAALSNTADPTLSGTELLRANRAATVEVLYIVGLLTRMSTLIEQPSANFDWTVLAKHC